MKDTKRIGCHFKDFYIFPLFHCGIGFAFKEVTFGKLPSDLLATQTLNLWYLLCFVRHVLSRDACCSCFRWTLLFCNAICTRVYVFMNTTLFWCEKKLCLLMMLHFIFLLRYRWPGEITNIMSYKTLVQMSSIVSFKRGCVVDPCWPDSRKVCRLGGFSRWEVRSLGHGCCAFLCRGFGFYHFFLEVLASRLAFSASSRAIIQIWKLPNVFIFPGLVDIYYRGSLLSNGFIWSATSHLPLMTDVSLRKFLPNVTFDVE